MIDRPLSAAYLAAIDASNQAHRAYALVLDAYRARTVGDADLFAAQQARNAANAVFDAAFSLEQES